MSQRSPASLSALRCAVEEACKPTRVSVIESGRLQVLLMEAQWVRDHIVEVAREVLNPDDDWEYRRFLELLAMACPELVSTMIAQGLSSTDPDVREAAEDFNSPEYVLAVGREFIQSLAERHSELRLPN